MSPEKDTYEDILHLPRPVYLARPRMSLHDRAAQFAPFAALTGYDAVIEETGRLTEGRVELSEDGRAELDTALHRLAEQLSRQPAVTVQYFLPDERKAGGAYITVTGHARSIDVHRQCLLLSDGTHIPLGDIRRLDFTDAGPAGL